jgi:DNA-binding transcriptional MerR regulator
MPDPNAPAPSSARKAPDAFRTISEAAELLGLPQHVLRHWEDTFGAIRPMRRAGGRRYYRTQDLELLAGIRQFLHDRKFTARGVQKIFAERGAGFVAEVGRAALQGGPMPALDAEPPGASPEMAELPPMPRVSPEFEAARTRLYGELQMIRAQLQALRTQLGR